jgi:hypothetical protein
MKFPVDPPSTIIDAVIFLLIFAFNFIRSDDVTVDMAAELMYNGIDEDLVIDDSEEAPSLSTESDRFPNFSC